MIEADGTYGGDILACASKNHEHHFGTNDSIYWQVRLQVNGICCIICVCHYTVGRNVH